MPQNSHNEIQDGGRGKSLNMTPQQWGALIGGSALAIFGITRRSPLGVALAAGGSTIALLGANQRPQSSRQSAWTTLLINCTPREAYQFWQNLENLPRFMNRLERVTVLDDRRSRWTAIGPTGKPIEWVAEISDSRNNEYIVWRTLPGSDVQMDGRVDFQEAPAGRGTFVSARFEFRQMPGLNPAFASYLNKAVSFAVRQDLRRLESLIETGEIATTEGQSHGPRDLVTGALRVADPTRPIAPRSSLGQEFARRRSIA